MTIHNMPRRGIMAVRAEGNTASVLAELTDAFGDFRTRYDRRLADIEAGVGDLAARAAGVELGLGGAPASDDRAMAAIGTVLRDARTAGGPTDVTAAMVQAVNAAGMSVDSDPDGGFSVIPSFDRRIRTIARDEGAMRAIADIQVVGSDAWEHLVSTDPADSGWVGERQARPDTDGAKLRKVRIPVHEIYAQPKVTQKLLDDSAVDIAGFIAREVGTTFGEQEAEAFISGDGELKPRGLLTHPTAATGDAAREWGTFEHVNTGASGAFASSDPADVLVTTVYKLKAGYRRGARWLMNSESVGTVRKMKDGEGRYLWQDAIAEGEPPRLLGFPVAVDEFMPSIAANSLSIAFGNFQRGYTVVDRLGIRVLVDPFTQKPFVKYYTTMRVGGGVTDFNAVKFIRFGS